MKKLAVVLVIVALALCVFVFKSRAGSAAWTESFGIDKADLSSTGSNPYFILEPGYQLSFEGKRANLTITVLDETKTIDGVETRVVEEKRNKGRQTQGSLTKLLRHFQEDQQRVLLRRRFRRV